MPRCDQRHVVHNRSYWDRRNALKQELDALFRRRRHCNKEEKMELEKQINEKVVNFNTMEGPVDLHWMTPQGAIEFVEAIVERKRRHGVLEIIVGKGNHSRNKKAAIKEELMMKYGKEKRCCIKEKEGNSGVLLLDMW
uniref:Smr domain-containing protein n=1 Tax=Caenorhabditis tropicalis TaxID=1561998 RepID=A0A1I7UTS4_9PELO